MPIYGTGEYWVNRRASKKVRKAIEEFVKHVRSKEPGTMFYAAWQDKDDPTHFMHFYIFDNELALNSHSNSDAVKRFESVYEPELARGPVVFTDYTFVAMNRKVLKNHSQKGVLLRA